MRILIIASIILFAGEAFSGQYQATTEGGADGIRICLNRSGTRICSRNSSASNANLRRRIVDLSGEINTGFFSDEVLGQLREGFDPRGLYNSNREEACGNITRLTRETEQRLEFLRSSSQRYTCSTVPQVPRNGGSSGQQRQ